MSKIYFTLALASLLSACGGGADTPATATTAATATPATVTPTVVTPAPVTTPVSTSTTLAAMPAVAANAFKTSTGGTLTLGTNAQIMDVSFSGAANASISGQLNKLWIDAKTAGGTVTVDGTQNTIVFRPGVDTTVNVTGNANTFIMAEGSKIKITGTGAASSTVQYYK